MPTDFDTPIQRRGSMCRKWDDLGRIFEITAPDALAMWVADMDFHSPAFIQRALERTVVHGVYGYPGDNAPYLDAIRWWMKSRHGWQIACEDILTVHGLINGIAIAVEALTQPGDRIIVMTPVYHAFARVVRAAGRALVELPLAIENGRYELNWSEWDNLLTGNERMLILCSPHNPGGRIWTPEELRQIADFAKGRNLIVVSDEIHHDLVLPGQQPHTVLAVAAPDLADQLVTMTAATKTFNIAGGHLGNIIITDPALRKRYETRLAALGISPGLFGPQMVTAAYSPEGAEWVNELTAYIAGNVRLFNDGMNKISGVRAMELQSTYLGWVDFSGLGLTQAELHNRFERQARIAANHGESFGPGGEGWMRVNLATPRSRIAEAVERLQTAFNALVPKSLARSPHGELPAFDHGGELGAPPSGNQARTVVL